MRTRLTAFLMMASLAGMTTEAQETRGNINGTVQDSSGVVPGATVTITNVDNGQSQKLVTNGSGYFEAPLLQAGPYRVTVDMEGFKGLTQSGITLSVGQSLTLKLTLEVGAVTERVDVSAKAPLLDTTSVSSGQTYDQALISGLPMASNMPILLARFAQGVVSPTTQVQVISGQIDGPTNAAGSVLGGVGGFNYTIDGATNAGSSRRIASSPNADMIEEMRVETSNFDAAQGHGTGGTIAMMTRAGSNSLRGTANYQYWTNKINSLNPQQKLAFSQRPETGRIYEGGYENYIATTLGGPVVIPRVVDGRNKLFFFANYQRNYDNAPAQSTPTSTVPANERHLNGDFSDLLALPNGSQYQIFDPLTVRPDPARPGSFIRTAFPNNIIPRDRFMNADGSYKNPLFALYRDMSPTPNQNFVESGQVPANNYYQGGIPNQVTAQNFGGRVDYNLSSSDRFFFRASGTTFYEYNTDWTYETKYAGLHSNDKTRASWSYTGNWTKVRSSTVIDTQVSANRFYEDQQRRGLHEYKPTDLGLPAYLDEYCQSLNNCMMPTINVGGYQSVSTGADGGLETTNLQAQSNVTSVKGTHTLRGGVDYRLAMRRAGLMTAGNVSSTYNFDNTYTRAADTTAVFPTNNVGPSLAALMLGIPTSVSIGQNAPISMRNPYYSGFFQDTWRAASNLTLNFGLRYEFEDGITESQDRWLTEFEPDARLSITDLAQAAYARNPIPQVPVTEFRVLGGSIYATAPGATGSSWKGESMWMPRVSGAYTMGERTVIKGGYGLFYDTLNAGDYTGFNQLGYSAATTNVSSTDFGQTWLLGDPRNGISPVADPFPLRVGGGRFEVPIEDALGVDAILGTSFTREDPNRRHARVQRWRVGVQQELLRNLAVEIAYSGSYADRVGRSINEVYVPEQYYSSITTVRDATQQALLQQQVPNPFNIANFISLATTNPTLYQRMAGNAFFTATTVQRQALLRGYPQLSGLVYNNLPLGVVKDHALEITVNRRYSGGLSANLAFAARRLTENRTVEAYDREPTIWQTSQNARPWRLSGGAVYELPFGSSKRFLKTGVAGKILGGWQMGGTMEYQPGALLDWGNLFFNGDLSNIAKDKPEIALQRDGTIDLTKTWFNIDAGFERDAGKQPAAFQKRSFPFRIDGVRGAGMLLVNANIVRNLELGGHGRLQVRVDVQNLFDAVQWGNPNLDPTSTNFGRITTATNSIMRFFTFVTRYSF
jgi:Carboxypeptidase regulatory-like domain